MVLLKLKWFKSQEGTFGCLFFMHKKASSSYRKDKAYMGSHHMSINLTVQIPPKMIKMNFIAIKDFYFSFWRYLYS
ncbi:hypothetical protein C6351_30970 [Bacillus thuringiensis]|nr:hypothetical protein C6351_30970 [Bacillus thuringiensis]